MILQSLLTSEQIWGIYPTNRLPIEISSAL
jgi:hypothetical protein